MAEEFYYRTRGFAGTVRERLPIYVFRRAEDYYAAGGLRGSAGAFDGQRLMAIAGESTSARTWHIIQHEAFHQFAAAALGRELPTWANEGLAEYFGHGRFTGDHFFTGLIPPERLARVREGIRAQQFRPLIEMMRLAHDRWNIEVGLGSHAAAASNYDQAWAMVHFLAHADDGRYQDAFASFLRAISHGQAWEQAWVRSFGNDVSAFQQRWEEYWLGLPDHPTEELYTEATVATITSFYARAFSQRQFFETFEAFVTAAQANQLEAHEEDWLPPTLLKEALEDSQKEGRWSIRRRGKPAVVCERPDGTVIEGRFQVTDRRVKNVDVVVLRANRGRD
jgi:hypothetical protein